MSSPPPPFKFGPFDVPASTVFYSSSETSAFVNLRPIVPGHVLVCPKRSGVKRLRDLTDAEYEDLWRTVRKVQEVVEDLYEASASNVAVQDGIGAGQR